MQYEYTMLSRVASPVLTYFPTLSLKTAGVSKKKLLNVKRVFLFSLQLYMKYFSF